MKKNDRSLTERLEVYAASGALPMHMPGHKRNMAAASFLCPLGGKLDITEIDGFDDLHHADGLLQEEMDRAAALWGARRTFFLINGSSGGLLAAIYALGSGGGQAIVARNCHKSVCHGLELCGLTPHWVQPEWCASLGMWGSVSPAEVERALDETPNARFLLITSPTYEGIISDIASIAGLCHAREVPLIVDEAHGAHLGPAGAVCLGADIVVQSAHKTLPSLTQTALLHLSGVLADERMVERALNMFETSSPSYLLMASLSGCVRFLEGQSPFAHWQEGLRIFDRDISGLKRLSVPNHGTQAGRAYPGVFRWDRSKIMICPPVGSGYALMEALRRRFSIELEMGAPHYALAMTGAGDDTASLARLARALLELDREDGGEAVHVPGPPPEPSPVRLGIGEALRTPWETVTLEEATGRVCAQYLWVYPPGVPLAVPGEELTEEQLDWLNSLTQGGAELRSSPRGKSGTVRVTKRTATAPEAGGGYLPPPERPRTPARYPDLLPEPACEEGIRSRQR